MGGKERSTYARATSPGIQHHRTVHLRPLNKQPSEQGRLHDDLRESSAAPERVHDRHEHVEVEEEEDEESRGGHEEEADGVTGGEVHGLAGADVVHAALERGRERERKRRELARGRNRKREDGGRD